MKQGLVWIFIGFSPAPAIRRSPGTSRPGECLSVFLLIVPTVHQRISNPDFSDCPDLRGTATAVNDVENFDSFRLDTVDDQVFAMTDVPVNTGLRRNEATNRMVKIMRRKLALTDYYRAYFDFHSAIFCFKSCIE